MEPEKKSNGALVGLVIIIIILVVGGIYMWKVNKDSVENTNEVVTPQDSTDLDNLNADLEATDVGTGVDVNTVN